jgi:hypothetical protein
MGARRALVALLIVALVATAAGADSGGGDGSRGARSRVSSRNVGAGHQARRFGGGALGSRRAPDDDDDDDDADVGLYRGERRPVPIVLPDPADPTKLTLRSEGLDFLRSVRGPIAPVVVIGPYRSGKSFLLNQLLGVSCGEGFGVGHTRKTETKGVWAWSAPERAGDDPNAPGVVYVDTEGFEATGMSDAYDDRIFALSSIMASVLVYNLPETVKEGDIEKLSFALELAREFSSRARDAPALGGSDASAAAADDDDDTGNWDASQMAAFLPGSLLWLIQRDFLEGSTVNEMVRGALREVSNPSGDRHVDELNRIRASLRTLASNFTALGLTQPHLERTKLCDMGDDELEPRYVRQRAELKALVRREARAKSSLGAALGAAAGADSGRMTGPALATLVERSVRALNEGDFPSAGNVVDSFNRDAMERHVASYVAALDAVRLPAEEEALTTAHRDAASRATEGFRRDRFGRGAVTVKSLRARLEEIRDARLEKNAFVSGHECEALATSCEEALVGLQTMRLPSLRKFDDSAKTCSDEFERRCVGPSHPTYAARVARSLERERAAFTQSYNARLLNGMLLFSVGGIVAFRFVWVLPLAELASWAAFLVLELGPKLYITPGESMFDSTWWKTAARFWELAVYNPFVDMDRVGPALAAAFLAVALWIRVRRFVSWVHSCCPCLVPRCCHPLLGVKNEDRKRRGGRKTERGRDLDV